MTVAITYETPDGTDTLERDEWHNDTDGFVTAYNAQDAPGVSDKVSIPVGRVVEIDHVETYP